MPAKRPEWLLVSDIDNTLTGDDAALAQLMRVLQDHCERIAFGVASGRSLELIRAAVRDFGLNEPDLIIASVGSEIYAGGAIGERYSEHIAEGWQRQVILDLLRPLPGLTLQDAEAQKRHKISFTTQGDVMTEVEEAVRRSGHELTLIHSHGEFLDVLPKRAGKGQAVRFVSEALALPLSHIVVAGDSGNDEDMLLCGANAVVVGNYSEELAKLVTRPDLYVAQANYAAGVLEGLRHYGAVTTEVSAEGLTRPS